MEASNHSIINHGGAGSLYQKTENGQLVCPFASNLNCAATFGKPQQIRKHVSSIHQGLKLPCPVVTEKGCKGTFSGWTSLRDHLVQSHRPPRFVCPRPNCTIAFTSSNAVRDHVKGVILAFMHYVLPTNMMDGAFSGGYFPFVISVVRRCLLPGCPLPMGPLSESS